VRKSEIGSGHREVPFRSSLSAFYGPPAVSISDDLNVGLTGGVGDTLDDEPRLVAAFNITQKLEHQIPGRIEPDCSRLGQRTEQWVSHSSA